ncbi:MAG: WD40 repeat domain-containing serine/threonine protein kinase [Kofleriaceae bacterium]
MVPKDDDDVGSARTAAPVATAQTVATTPPDAAHSATMAAGAAHSATMVSSNSLDAIGEITPESLGVVSPQVYIQLDEFARGGLGRIIRAKDTRTGRIVAIKEMLSSTEDAAVRFAREAMITANLQHPAIVPVYEVGRWTSGKPFYAMKLVSGRPFDQVIASTKSIDDRLALVSHVLAVADALAYAHGERVIHRDLKPHNVLVGAYGETVVIDWGLARRLDDVDNPAASHRVISAVPGQTFLGAVMGTPAYMPPEQARGQRVDERADVYAIGAILYHLLAGKPPYAGKSLDELLVKVKAGKLEALNAVDPSIPADLAAIVEHAMARELADRYGSAAELAADLRRFTTGQLVRAHRYTRMQRIGRFVARNRAAVAIASIAVVAGAIGGTLAVRNIMATRDLATTAQSNAEQARDVARRRLVDATVDRARAELADNQYALALAYTIAAAELGGLDDRLRFIAERSLDSQSVFTRFDEPGVMSVLYVPGSHDVIISSKTGIRRWDSVRGRVIWERVDGMFTGDAAALDAKTGMAVRVHGVELFDFATGAVSQMLQASPKQAFQGMFGLDSSKRWLAVPIMGGQVALFDLSTRSYATTISAKLVDHSPIVERDAERFAFIGAVSEIRSHVFIMTRAGTLIEELCSNCTRAIALGDEIVIAELGTNLPAKLRIFDWSGAQKREFVATTTGDVADLIAFPDGKRLALAMTDGTIEVHHRDTGLMWRRATGERSASLSLDTAGRLWMHSTFRTAFCFEASTGAPIGSWLTGGVQVFVSEDGGRATTLSLSKGVSSFEIRSPITVIAPSTARVRKLVFLPNHRFLTGSEDGLVAVVEPGKPPREIVRHASKVLRLQLIDAHRVLSSSAEGVFVHDLNTGARLASTEVGSVAAASPNGAFIAIGGPQGEVFLWDTTAAPRSIGKLGVTVAAVRWSPDGLKFGAIAENAELEVWDRSGKSLVRIPASNTDALDLSFSSNSTHVTRSFKTRVDNLHAIEPGTPSIELEPAVTVYDRYSLTFSFAPDDSMVAMAGTQVLALWDLPSGKLRHNFSVNADQVPTAFSRDATMLFSGGVDRKTHLWDVDTGLELTSLEATHEVYGLVVDPAEDRIAILTLGPAMIWDVKPFAGTLDELKRLAACRIEVEIVDGAVKRRPTDADADCNSQR